MAADRAVVAPRAPRSATPSAPAHPAHPPEVVVPRPPEARPAAAFPIAATLAPVVFSVVVWAITGSAFALVFAALGPVVALASLADNARTGRRHSRRESRRFDAELEGAESALTALLEQRRFELERQHPPVTALAPSARDPEVWADGADIGAAVRVGSGVVESGIHLGAPVAPPADSGPALALRELAERSRAIRDAPIVLDAREGIGFCGPDVAGTAAARALVMRLARLTDPARWSVRTDARAGWEWLSELPHTPLRLPRIESPGSSADGEEGAVTIEFERRADVGTSTVDPPPLRVAVAPTPDDLPRWCRQVVDVDLSGLSRSYPRGSPRAGTTVIPDVATAEEARALARALGQLAAREGRGAVSGLPAAVHFGGLDHDAAELTDPPAAALTAVVGVGADGEVALDLVGEGPHLVIGGTTGSGKSELLVTLVLALAARYPPERVTFLLVDFKGGSAFDALADLPHRVGTITDLDTVAAQRALESLRAETRHREEQLARVGARSIDERRDAHALPRLVIVVDEFAALAEVLPELHSLFADLAARGRSLGIHLVLCTQRPAASIRDAILANCTLRICLRVNDAADSTALVGVSDGARLPRLPSGRALLARAGERPSTVQVAISTRADAAAVAARWPPPLAVRRPWRDPLPAILPLDRLPMGPTPAVADESAFAAPIVFALADLPQRQSQEPAIWVPSRDGPLVVLGARGTGKSTALAAVAARSGRATFVPRDVEGAWDHLTATLDALRGGAGFGPASPGAVLLVDDLDTTLERVGRDHELEFAEIVARVLREAPRQGLALAVSLASIPGPLQAALAACEARLLLRQASRQEHLLAGGASAEFDPGLPPGGARWRGERVQVGMTAVEPAPAPVAPQMLDLAAPGITAVVSTRTRALLDRLRARRLPDLRLIDLATAGATGAPGAGARADPSLVVATAGEPTVVIGDPEAWQSAFAAHAAARASARWVFDGCSVAEFRAVTRSRRTPPVLAAGADHAWLLDRHNTISRVRLG